MKFLVITRPNGQGHGLESSTSSTAGFASEIKKLRSENVLEAAYAFIGGGSAYVILADTSKQLAVLVRSNPLFHTQHHEIIPIADADDFLEGYIQHFS